MDSDTLTANLNPATQIKYLERCNPKRNLFSVIKYLLKQYYVHAAKLSFSN